MSFFKPSYYFEYNHTLKESQKESLGKALSLVDLSFTTIPGPFYFFFISQ